MMEIEFDPFALLVAVCVTAVAIWGFVSPVSYVWILENYWQPILLLLGAWFLIVAAFLKIIAWCIDG